MSAPLMPMTTGIALYSQVQSIPVGIEEKHALTDARQVPEQIQRAQYISRLRRVNWHGQDADEMRALRELQASIDPDGELWNRNAPLGHLITRRVKVISDLPAGGRDVKWMTTGLNDVDLVQHFMEVHGLGTRVTVIVQPSALPFAQVPA